MYGPDFADARQKNEQRAGLFSKRVAYAGGGRIDEPLFARRRPVFDLRRMGSAADDQHRRVAEQFVQWLGSQRGRHHEQAQIGSQRLLRFPRQRQAQVGGERALVKFVEQHRGIAGEFGIALQHANQDAFGHDFDPGAGRDLRLQPGAETDRFAGGLAPGACHETRRGAGRQPARLQHQDLPVASPNRVQQCNRYAGGLAGAGRRLQYRGRRIVQRREKLRQKGVDGQLMRIHGWGGQGAGIMIQAERNCCMAQPIEWAQVLRRLREWPVVLLGSFVLIWLALGYAPKYRDDWVLENVLVVAFVPLLVWGYRRVRFSTLAYTAVF